MSTANDALLYNLGQDGFPITDDVNCGQTAQGLATAAIGCAIRIVTSVANGALILKSTLTNEANLLMFVINDSPNTIKVFPFTGETLNGTLNQSLSISAGQSGIFVRVPPATSRGGGNTQAGDWRAAAIP